jgi:3-hydroxyacyl-CoA dehydrogenase
VALGHSEAVLLNEFSEWRSVYSLAMSLEYRCAGGVAFIAIDAPPVNAFGLPLRRALVDAFVRLRQDDAVRAVVVHGHGKGFSAGGDRSEFGRPEASARPTLSRDVLAAVESCGKPVIAAIHGFAVGGGLEFALACGARVAVASARIGLPEVTIGRFPLSGSQRLPRLVGIERAAEWMFRAETTRASDPRAALLFDRLVDRDEELLAAAAELALTATHSTLVPVRERPFLDADPSGAIRDVAARYVTDASPPAQRALLAALQAAIDAPDFQSGLDRAHVIFDALTG